MSCEFALGSIPDQLSREIVVDIDGRNVSISGGGVPTNRALATSMRGKRRVHVDLILDRLKARVVLLVDGNRVLESMGVRALPEFCELRFRTSRSIRRIQDIRVASWDGLPLWREAEPDRIFLNNGDSYDGVIRAISPTTVSTEMADLPLESIASICFQGAYGRSNNRTDILVQLQGGGQIFSKALTGTEVGLAFEDASIGRVRVPPDSIRRIVWPPHTRDHVDGYIRKWLLLGPISVTRGGKDGKLTQEELGNRHVPLDARPVEGSQVTYYRGMFVRTISWTGHSSNRNGMHTSLGKNQLCIGIAYVVAPAAMSDVTLSIGSDDESIWHLNGTEVLRALGQRDHQPDQDAVRGLRLEKGLNVLRAACYNADGGSAFSARFLDARGKPIHGLTVRLKPDEALQTR